MKIIPFTVPFAFAAVVLLTAAAALHAEEKGIVKPGLFKTLVNPECSHCVDESKRRAGDLRENDRVLAWIRGKYDGGAVPFRFFLVPYRVISDTYGVWVYDADAEFVRGYEPSLDFTFHGWRHGIMTIEHKDGTIFSALSGLGISGPRAGEFLKPLPIIETDWGYWLKQYPGTVAYNMFAKYQAHELPPGKNEGSVATRLPADRRLPEDEKVIGLAIGRIARAYPISILATNKIIRDRIGDQEIAVLWYEPTKTAAIFAPRMDNETVPDHLRLESNPQIPTAPFMDKETFSHWTVDGRAVEGPLKGKTLTWQPAVSCQWFAWAAEYPHTEIYRAGTKFVETEKEVVAKLISGERLDWDHLAKTMATLVAIDPAAGSALVLADSDKKEHAVVLNSQTEFYFHGSWGDSTSFAPGQRVYVIATTDADKKWITGHAIADEISMQSMSAPMTLQKTNGHTFIFGDSQSRKKPMTLSVGKTLRIQSHTATAPAIGRDYYFNSVDVSPGERALAELYDASSFQEEKNRLAAAQKASVTKYGARATVWEIDEKNGRVALLVRRADALFARTVKAQDRIRLRQKTDDQPEFFTVAAVRPDYARTRILLEVSSTQFAQFRNGADVRLLMDLPEKLDPETPPDLGRFSGRQERIDYLLSTIYCPCGMLGTACAGHWNTLAACKLHGCGMPDVITRQVGAAIDHGRSDAEILAELSEKHGPTILRQHQN